MHGVVPLKATHGLHSASKRQPDKTAVIFGARSVSYCELTARMARVTTAATMLSGTAAIVATNKIEYLEVLLGLADAGIPVATINPKGSKREVVNALRDCRPVILFIDEKLYHDEYLEICSTVITFGEQYDIWLSQHQPISDYPYIDDSTTFAIVYSSGTTGAPKGIKHSHRSRMMISYTMAIDYNCMKEDDTILAVASLSNGGGCSVVLACLNNGGTVVFGTQVHPDYLMRMVEQYKVTCAFLVPTLLHIIVNTPSCHRYDRSSLRGVFSSAAPLSADLKLTAAEFFGDVVYDVYASTECGPVSVLKPKMLKAFPGSVGVSVSGAYIEIRREDGTKADVGEVGEVFAKTLTLFSGYMSADPPDCDFISAGDLGYVDSNQTLYIVGRKSDMIITGGHNVYPEEVEAVINNCPGVKESAVIGTPDDKWGEIVTAFIVGDPEIDPVLHCRSDLATYKIPRKIFYVESIPRNDAGKILRKNLRNYYK